MAKTSRGSFRLLADPIVGAFFFGRLLSTTGMWVHNIAAAVVVYELTASALLVGAVSVAQFVPQLVLGPLGGARADRGDRSRQLITGRVIASGGSGGLFAWILVMGLEGVAGTVAVIVAAFVVGVGFALGGPAMQAVIPSLARPSELAAIVALNSVPVTLARAGGPALGVGLITFGGPAWAFGFATACQVVFACILVLLRIQDPARDQSKDSRIRAGVNQLRTDPAIAALLLGTAMVGIGTDPAITLAPSIAQNLGGGTSLVGTIASAFGVGAAAAFPILAWFRRRLGSPRLATVGLFLLAAGLAALAISPTPTFALASIGVAGTGMTFSLTSFTTLIQQRSPEDLRGRIMALWSVAFLGSRPLAAAVNGTVADLGSTTLALFLAVAALLVGAWFSRPSRTDPSSQAKLS